MTPLEPHQEEPKVTKFRSFFARFRRPRQLSALPVRIDDGHAGWLSARPHAYDAARVQEIYADALEAWRKNPIAWRTVSITTDYVVGDVFTVSSRYRPLDRFIRQFWSHPKNRMGIRIEAMCDELGRAGDLFVVLFRNPQDGMSYIRFVTKDRIRAIETAPNDWETELSYTEMLPDGGSQVWLSPAHPEAGAADAVMLHYAVNRPLGAMLGESDLVTMLPWLLRYSRMLEDRVRLHWAMRAFLWMITVPANKVREKQEQYRTPPEPGSIVVKDESEKWEVQNPNLHGQDARYDMQAVRAMIDAGSGYPPHWRGDASDISLATAQAMQGPTERHLRRRQNYFIWMLEDILFTAYLRAAQVGMVRPLPTRPGTLSGAGAPCATASAGTLSGAGAFCAEAQSKGAVASKGVAASSKATACLYEDLFTVHLPDISRYDNDALASAASKIAAAYASLADQLPKLPPSLARETLRIVFKFSGESTSQRLLDQILAESHPQAKKEEPKS